jgi:hypothetical protein
MDIAVTLIKYVFVVALGVETLIILRALVDLARTKAREAAPAAPVEE